MVEVGLNHGRCNGGANGKGIEHHDRPSESSGAEHFQTDCGPICPIASNFSAYGVAGRPEGLHLWTMVSKERA